MWYTMKYIVTVNIRTAMKKAHIIYFCSSRTFQLNTFIKDCFTCKTKWLFSSISYNVLNDV
jgi:hypothetical protein